MSITTHPPTLAQSLREKPQFKQPFQQRWKRGCTLSKSKCCSREGLFPESHQMTPFESEDLEQADNHDQDKPQEISGPLDSQGLCAEGF